jgi:hypothetical protein
MQRLIVGPRATGIRRRARSNPRKSLCSFASQDRNELRGRIAQSRIGGAVVVARGLLFFLEH